MAKTEESKLEQEVEKFMREKRIWQLVRFQAQYNQNGLPDRLYLYKGLLLGLELKTDKGVPTILQLRKLKEINNNGGLGLIVRSADDVKKLIEIIDRINLSFSYYLPESRSYAILQEWLKYEESKN